MFSELPGPVIWYLTLIGKILTHYCFKISSVPFSLSSPYGVPITHVLHLSQSSHCPWLLASGFSVWLLLVFFSDCSLCFLVFEDSIDIASNLEILSSATSSLLIRPSRHPSCLSQYFLCLAFLFVSFLWLPPLSSHYPSVLTYGLFYQLEPWPYYS